MTALPWRAFGALQGHFRLFWTSLSFTLYSVSKTGGRKVTRVRLPPRTKTDRRATLKTNAQPPRTGLHQERYDNGQVSIAGRFVKGRKTGLWKYYLRNGVVRAQGRFGDGHMTGTWRFNRESGVLWAVGGFAVDRKQGLWKRYHPNGKLLDVGRFVAGKPAGVWKTYNDRGKLTKTKIFRTRP